MSKAPRLLVGKYSVDVGKHDAWLNDLCDIQESMSRGFHLQCTPNQQKQRLSKSRQPTHFMPLEWSPKGLVECPVAVEGILTNVFEVYDVVHEHSNQIAEKQAYFQPVEKKVGETVFESILAKLDRDGCTFN